MGTGRTVYTALHRKGVSRPQEAFDMFPVATFDRDGRLAKRPTNHRSSTPRETDFIYRMQNLRVRRQRAVLLTILAGVIAFGRDCTVIGEKICRGGRQQRDRTEPYESRLVS